MKKWKAIAEDTASMYIHAAAYMAAMATKLQEVIGLSNSWAARFNGAVVAWCADVAEMEQSGKLTLAKLENKDFFQKVVVQSNYTIIALEKEAESISKLKVAGLTDAQLVEVYRKLFEKWADMNLWGHVVNLADFEHFMLSNRIIAFLEKSIEETKSGTTAAEAFSVLVTPTKRSRLQQQDIDFCAVLAMVQKNETASELFQKQPSAILQRLSEFPEIKLAIRNHTAKYQWMQFHYDGPTVLDELYFAEVLTSSHKQKTDARHELEKILNHEKETLQRQKQLAVELKLGKMELYWLEVAREFAFLKALRKDVAFEACCNSFSMIKEFARRLKITPRQVRFMSIRELEEALKTKKVNVNEINERARRSVVTFEDGDSHFHIGKEGEAYFAMVYDEEVDKQLSEVKGTPAFPGKVKGVVKILRNAEDMKSFQPGNVLVSPATNPNLISAMKMAGAIVTDEGGITCHAAIVSRELKIPCVIGTKVATKWLKDGDKVEVDAIKGIVRKV